MEDSTEEVAVEGKRSLRIRTKQTTGKDSKDSETSSERQVNLRFDIIWQGLRYIANVQWFFFIFDLKQDRIKSSL